MSFHPSGLAVEPQSGCRELMGRGLPLEGRRQPVDADKQIEALLLSAPFALFTFGELLIASERTRGLSMSARHRALKRGVV